jgi:hypothetical protein
VVLAGSTGTAGRSPVVGQHGGDRRPAFPVEPFRKGR